MKKDTSEKENLKKEKSEKEQTDTSEMENNVKCQL